MITDYLTALWFALTLFCALCIQSRDDRIANQDKLTEYLSLRLVEAELERDEARQQLVHLQERTSKYLAEAHRLVSENECLKARCRDILETDELIEAVEGWLSKPVDNNQETDVR
jgi:uncharacterized coiled-coil protein SlyX